MRGTSMRSSSIIKQHFHEVREILRKGQIYSDSVITSELDWYYNHLEFPEFYFIRFTPGLFSCESLISALFSLFQFNPGAFEIL